MVPQFLSSALKADASFDQQGKALPEPLASSLPRRRLPGVLVVDDDLGIRTLLNIVLRQHGFAVWLTADGYQALKAYQGHRDDIDLVLIDVRMPGLDGPQTLALLQQLNPALLCCFITGDPEPYTEDELMNRGADRIIYKPFRVDEVARLLKELVSRSSATQLSTADVGRKPLSIG